MPAVEPSDTDIPGVLTPQQFDASASNRWVRCCCLDIICLKAGTVSGKPLKHASESPPAGIFDTEEKKNKN